jgi:hypothetical protein
VRIFGLAISIFSNPRALGTGPVAREVEHDDIARHLAQPDDHASRAGAVRGAQAAGLIFSRAPECRYSTGIDPTDEAVAAAHGDALVRLLLGPGPTRAA